MKSFFFVLALCYAYVSFASSELYKSTQNKVVKIVLKSHGMPISQGSGFFWGPDGVIVTNAHVIDQNKFLDTSIEITTSDGKKIENVKIAQCEKKEIDLCFLQVATPSFAYFLPAKNEFELGEKIYVIGHSLGLDYTISDGLLSGKRKFKEIDTKALKDYELYQISAPISPGNSGGPVFNSKGDLVGVSTFNLNQENAQNLNFAISSNEVSKIHALLKNENFISFSDFMLKKKAHTLTLIQKMEHEQNEILKALAGNQISANRLNRSAEIKSQSTPYVLRINSPSQKSMCKAAGDVGICNNMVSGQTILTFTTPEQSKILVRKFEQEDNKTNELFNEISKKQDSPITQEVINKYRLHYTMKFRSEGCAEEKINFINIQKEFSVCNYSVENFNSPGEKVHFKVISIDESTSLNVFSRINRPELQNVVLNGNKLLFAFSEFAKVDASTFKPRPKNEISSHNVKGTILELSYSHSISQVLIKYKTPENNQKSIFLKINANDYKLPPLQPGDQFDLSFDSTSYEFESFLTSTSYTLRSSFQLNVPISRENVMGTYQVSRIDVKPGEIGLALMKDGVLTRAYFYGKALENIGKLSLQKGDLITLPTSDVFQDYRVSYLKPYDFKKSQPIQPNIHVAQNNSAIKNVQVSNPEKEYIGIITSLKFYVRNDEASLVLELQVDKNSYRFTLDSFANKGKFDNLPLLDKGDQLKITVLTDEKNLARMTESEKFYLKSEEFKIAALKANSSQKGLEGKIKYLDDKKDSIRISLETTEGRKIIYVYDPDGIRALKGLALSEGDEISLDRPDFVSDGKYYIYSKKMTKFKHVKLK